MWYDIHQFMTKLQNYIKEKGIHYTQLSRTDGVALYAATDKTNTNYNLFTITVKNNVEQYPFEEDGRSFTFLSLELAYKNYNRIKDN